MVDICCFPKIRQKLINIIKRDTAIEMHCTTNTDTLLHLIAEMFIQNWCKCINAILLRKISNVEPKDFMILEAEKLASRNTKKKAVKVHIKKEKECTNDGKYNKNLLYIFFIYNIYILISNYSNILIP